MRRTLPMTHVSRCIGEFPHTESGLRKQARKYCWSTPQSALVGQFRMNNIWQMVFVVYGNPHTTYQCIHEESTTASRHYGARKVGK